jgi:prepilin-type processing-associated H-X9-DG protein
LVVVAIISLLISILTPSLSRAREQAKSTLCLTRLNEQIKAATAYSGDHDFALPPLVYGVWHDETQSRSGEPDAWHGWAETLHDYVYPGGRDLPVSDFPVQRNISGDYELWVDKSAKPLVDSTGHYRPYGLVWPQGLDGFNPKIPMIMDANPTVTYEPDLEISHIVPERIAGLEGEAYVHERHYGGANYVWNDGHAERRTELKEELARDWDLDGELEVPCDTDLPGQ